VSCEFCEALNDKSKEITWAVRSTLCDDNTCAIAHGLDECDADCIQCNDFIDDTCYFSLMGYRYDQGGDLRVGLEYVQKIISKKKLIIHPFSVSGRWNFCPYCREQINEVIIPFESTEQIEVEDKMKPEF
jgi:hypothetical protein